MPAMRVLVCILVLILVGATARAQDRRLTFLHFNDVYEFTANPDSGGLAALFGLVEAERAAHPGALLTFGGDLISPSLASGLTQGAHMVEILGAMRPVAAVLGNHEFDFGAEVLRRRMAESAFPWLVSNVSEADGRPFGGGTRLLLTTVGDTRVGLFSLLTGETATLAAGGRDARFHPETETARAMVAELRRQGAELVVALTHQDIQADLDLARSVKGIDLILGGHDHEAMAVQAGPTLVVKAGHDGQYLAAVDVVVGGADGRPRPRLAGWRFLSSLDQPPSPALDALTRRHEAAIDNALGQPLAVLAATLDSRQDVARAGQSSFGALVADALRQELGADIALINGGGLRGNRVYAAGTPISRADLMREMPFGNTALVLDASGAQILAALEHGVSKLPALSGRFPQVSGVSFVIDTAAPAGQRIKDARVGGSLLESTRLYRLATVSYLAEGGDGYAMLTTLPRRLPPEAAPLLVNLVADHVRKQAHPGQDERGATQ